MVSAVSSSNFSLGSLVSSASSGSKKNATQEAALERQLAALEKNR